MSEYLSWGGLNLLVCSCQILDAVLKRQTMTSISADMDNWIEKRDQLSRKVEDLRKQRKIALAAKVSYNRYVYYIIRLTPPPTHTHVES